MFIAYGIVVSAQRFHRLDAHVCSAFFTSSDACANIPRNTFMPRRCPSSTLSAYLVTLVAVGDELALHLTREPLHRLLQIHAGHFRHHWPLTLGRLGAFHPVGTVGSTADRRIF